MKDTFLEAARAVPATVKLVYRLVRDERIDERKRAGVIAALAYAALPFDFIPDRFPIIGRVDDLVIGAAALQALFDEAGEELIRENWEASSGSLDALLGIGTLLLALAITGRELRGNWLRAAAAGAGLVLGLIVVRTLAARTVGAPYD